MTVYGLHITHTKYLCFVECNGFEDSAISIINACHNDNGERLVIPRSRSLEDDYEDLMYDLYEDDDLYEDFDIDY